MTQTGTRCPHCGAVMTPGARFCPECGRSPDATNNSSSTPWIIGGLIGLAIIVLLVFILLKLRGPSVVTAVPKVPTGPPVVSAPVRLPTGPPVTQAPRTPPDPMRAAVAAYLQRMAEIEAQRKVLVNDLYPAMMTMAMLKDAGGLKDALQEFDEDKDSNEKKPAPPPTVQAANQTISSYQQQLVAIGQEAQRVQPPPPAVAFHNGYLYMLSTYTAVMGQIGMAVESGDQSFVSQSTGLKLRVDQVLLGSDQELTRLANRYHLSKPFTVSDAMQGSLTGTEITP